jgi:hypothetical protein
MKTLLDEKTLLPEMTLMPYYLVFSQQNTGKKSTQKPVKIGQEMHPETGQNSAPSRQFVLHKLVGTLDSQITIGRPAQSVGQSVGPNG